MDHSALIKELTEITSLTPQERIALARQRREQQLLVAHERERVLPPPRGRIPRLQFSPEVEILEATGRGDYDEVRRLLEEGANPNSHNEDGLTPLHQCAIDNNERVVRLLLEYGANVNAKDTELWTPLHAAACCGYIEIVRLLIDHDADLLAVNNDGNMPYDICDDEHTLDLIESEMAGRGITQQYIDERRGLPEKEMLDDMKLLHQRGLPLDVRMPDQSTYLHIAAANGFYDVAAFLLRCGVHPSVRDADLWTPVHAAASWNQPDLIELLCEYGADINAKSLAGEMPIDLCEDMQTRQVISTLQHNEARKKRLAFGVRDSRRQSRKRKKFESPQQAANNADKNAENPFSARGTIRRQSLRDKTGAALARTKEAMMEHSDLVRSWSKEDVSTGQYDDAQPSSSHQQQAQRSQSYKEQQRRLGGKGKGRGGGDKQPQAVADEWLRKLEAESRHRAGNSADLDDEEEAKAKLGNGQRSAHGGSTRRGKKAGGANSALNGGAAGFKLPPGGGPISPTYGSGIARPANRHRKKGCCCCIM